MRIYVAADHAGFDLKARLTSWLRAGGHQVIDRGPDTYDEGDDYPPYVLRAACDVAADPGSFGIVLGGSGNGEAMAANKVRGIRAAVVWGPETARLAREHNDANVIALGARLHSLAEATRLVQIFLTTPFSGADRHRRRLGMLSRYEDSGELPPPSG